MKKQTALSIGLIFWFSMLYAQNGETLRRAIENALTFKVDMDSAKIPGFIIGCIDHDSTWIFAYGKVSKTNPVKPSATETYFDIGAMTQTFTATNAHLLIREGTLQSDSKVNAYLKPTERFAAGDKITARWQRQAIS